MAADPCQAKAERSFGAAKLSTAAAKAVDSGYEMECTWYCGKQ